MRTFPTRKSASAPASRPGMWVTCCTTRSRASPMNSPNSELCREHGNAQTAAKFQYEIEMRLITKWRSKLCSLSLREARAGREPERGVPNGLFSPALSSLWEEREKKLASGSPNLIRDPSIRLNLKAIWNKLVAQ